MRVVVFGASGVQGAHQVPVLARAGHDVVAINRNPKPLEVDGKPIETVAADFSDRPALARALKGADVVFLTLPSTSFNQSEPVIAGAKNIGQVAKEQGVKLIVFNTSMPVPEEVQNIIAQNDRREIRRILRETPIRDRNTVVYCHKPDLRVSWICHHDVAQLMMAAMEHPELAGRNFAVGGPETVVLSQLAEKLSRAWGRKLDYENQTVADFCDKISKTMQGRGAY